MAFGPIQSTMNGVNSKYRIGFVNTGPMAGVVEGSADVLIDFADVWADPEGTPEAGEALADAMVQSIVDALNSIPNLQAGGSKVFDTRQTITPTPPAE